MIKKPEVVDVSKRKYRTHFVVEELWIQILSEGCPTSTERVYFNSPADSGKDYEEELQKAIAAWEATYKSYGLVPKPVKRYYYKFVESFTKEGRFYKTK